MEHQEVRTFGEDAMKVQDIRTVSDLEKYANQRGLILWRASEQVGSLGRFGKRHGIYVAHVADETGEGYVYWFDHSCRDSQRGQNYLLTVRETRAEAREMYEEVVRGGYREDPEWFAEEVIETEPPIFRGLDLSTEEGQEEAFRRSLADLNDIFGK